MAGKQKSVFIRFNMADEANCDLYMKLAEAAGSSASLTAYVKRVLEEYFSVKMEISGRQEFNEQMSMVVREEMQAQGMKLVGALLTGIAAGRRRIGFRIFNRSLAEAGSDARIFSAYSGTIK